MLLIKVRLDLMELSLYLHTTLTWEMVLSIVI